MTKKTYFDQQPRRKAEFIKPPNTLKAKVGAGGLSNDILDKAQALLENNTTDFIPLAEIYLVTLMKGIESAKNASAHDDQEAIIAAILYPSMQLKANGGMFHYPMVTNIADKLIHFLEIIETADIDAIEIVLAFHTSIRAITLGKITGDGGKHGKELLSSLDDACERYFDRYVED